MTQTNSNSNYRRGIRSEDVCVAATRIEAAGLPGIHKASENGDIELVKDSTVKLDSFARLRKLHLHASIDALAV
jgi:hypothetical protein